jgi:predicted nucleic acid-binding protein
LSNLLIDTDVIIDALRGVEEPRTFFRQQRRQGNRLWISVLTLTELYCGERMGIAAEERRVRRFLRVFRLMFIDSSIAARAGHLVRLYGCSVPDTLIAATAQARGMTLVSRNATHFQNIDGLRFTPFSSD